MTDHKAKPLTRPLLPSAHGVGEIEGSAHFDMHGRLQGICYGRR